MKLIQVGFNLHVVLSGRRRPAVVCRDVRSSEGGSAFLVGVESGQLVVLDSHIVQAGSLQLLLS